MFLSPHKCGNIGSFGSVKRGDDVVRFGIFHVGAPGERRDECGCAEGARSDAQEAAPADALHAFSVNARSNLRLLGTWNRCPHLHEHFADGSGPVVDVLDFDCPILRPWDVIKVGETSTPTAATKTPAETDSLGMRGV